MMELLMPWAPAIGIFATVGLLMEAFNKTIGGKAGDEGFKGVWYVWKRVFAIPFGAGLGAISGTIGLSTPLGDGVGWGVCFGVLAAWIAGKFYKQIMDVAEAKARHKIARNGNPSLPEGTEKSK